MQSISKPVVLVLGLALGAFISATWFLGLPLISFSGNAYVSSASTATSSTPVATPDSGAVAVSDQKAGNSVLIDSVTVPPPGVWIAVREMSGTDLGNVLGAVRARGPLSDISVPLLRATLPGQTYAVMLYRDDGDGVFDANQDSVYVDFDTDQRVVVLFKTLP
jgi:hypothetical protein